MGVSKTVYELTCKWCRRSFTVESTARQRRRQYCGQECARHGNLKAAPQAPYRNTQAPEGHPLATGRTRTVGAHRLALWEKIGPGTHPCHYCAVPVTWLLPRLATGALEVDHLDRNRLNNSSENLVPCCHPCNMRNRSMNVSDDEPWRLHAGGWRIRGNPAVCQYCRKDYVARRDHQGLFCSRGCSNRSRGVIREVS